MTDDDVTNTAGLLAMHRLSIRAFQGLEREHRETIHQLQGDVAKVTQELHRTQLAFSKELIELKKLIEQPKEMMT